VAVSSGRGSSPPAILGGGRRAPTKLSHLVARDLRRMILRGELVPDQALPQEEDLMVAFEVSRDTLREAFRILESESLIRVQRGRGGGAVVQRPDVRSVARQVALLLQIRGATVGELVEARMVIEPSAAAEVVAVPAAEARVLAELHAAEQTRFAGPLECVRALGTFDHAVAAMSGNTTISVLSTVFQELVAGQAYRLGVLQPGSPALERLVGLHGSFVDAVGAGDSAAAQEVWSTYLAESGNLLSDEGDPTAFDIVPVWKAEASGLVSSLPPVKRAEAIAVDLRIAIAEGRLREGDQLPSQKELALEHQVWRSTIREAVRILEVEGLVDQRTGSRTGATVHAPTAESAAQPAGIVLAAAGTSMLDVVHARQLIEPPIWQLAAARIDPVARAELSKGVAELRGLVDQSTAFIPRFEQLERDALAAVGNTAIAVALEVLQWVHAQCRRYLAVRALSAPHQSESNLAMWQTLDAFVRASERQDVEGVGATWAAFLELIASFFRSEGGDRPIVELFD
jgi:DNA-binding FadR family transcriptional regulator